MGFFDFLKRKTAPFQRRGVQILDGKMFAEQLSCGYSTLADNPEVQAACFRIAQLMSSMTIYLMANTAKGDIRVINELSKKIDITPNKYMTRSSFMTAVVMNLLLYGDGNSIVWPHTRNGLLDSLEPIEARRVYFSDLIGAEGYKVYIDNVPHDPEELLHFTWNPDPYHLWHGQGFRLALRPTVDNLAQGRRTKKAFMNSKWKPSLIVKVDALTEEFSSPEGRQKLLDSYINTSVAGQPWLIPADQFQVEQVRPLSLSDLAINDTIELDKKTVASLLNVPAFVLGVGDYNSAEWDNFINSMIMPLAQSMQQEMTRKLILSPKMYLMFNMSRLYSFDLQKLAGVYGELYNKGIVTGNEVREKVGMQPMDGLDELVRLENYILNSDVGNQSKLKE